MTWVAGLEMAIFYNINNMGDGNCRTEHLAVDFHREMSILAQFITHTIYKNRHSQRLILNNHATLYLD